MNTKSSSLDQAQYLSLGTFRKTGIRVDTPVWFAGDGKHYFVLSNNQAGKVKRLRNGSRCQVAACTMLGKPLAQWQDANAFLLEKADDIEYAHRILKKKYGWQMLLLDSGAWLGGRIKQRTYIRIELN